MDILIPVNEEIIKNEGYHKYFGIELNRYVWKILLSKNRTADEDILMLHAAHGSCIHWMMSPYCTEANKQRGEWLLSRVYCALNIPDRALYHATRCKLVNDDYLKKMEDFDLAYSDEAMARALACGGRMNEAKKFLDSAKEKGNKIADKEASDIFWEDVKAEPWFGLND